MPDLKISQLPVGSVATGGEFAVVQSGVTTKLTATGAGAAMIEAANAAAQRTLLGLGTAALNNTGDFDAAGSAAAAQAASQPLDTDLTAIAALVSAANKVPYATGAGTWALADFTAAGRAMAAAATAAAQAILLGFSGTAGAVGAQLVALATLAAGSLLYANPANTIAELPIGGAGEVLTVVAGLPAWVANGNGSVTSVVAGTGLNVGAGPGGTITTTGTLNLANTAVTPGSYTNADITVDAQGRITAAASGSAGIAGSGAANQVAYWNGTSSLAGDAGFVFDPTNDQLALASTGGAARPQYSSVLDLDTGSYSVGANIWGVATGGVERLRISTTAVTNALQFLQTSGSAAAPGYSFAGNTGVGINAPGSSLLFVSGGANQLTVATTAITSLSPFVAPVGSGAAPSFTFTGRTDQGMYSFSTTRLDFSIGGAVRLALNTDPTVASALSTALRIAPGASTGAPAPALTVTLGAHTALTASTEYIGVLTTPGTLTFDTGALTTERVVVISQPTLAFAGASTVTTAATFAIAGAPVAGTNATITNSYALWVQAGASAFGGAVLGAAGSAAAPAYSYTGDPDTGAYSVGANNWGISTAGVLRFDISTTAITSTLPYYAPAGNTPGAPAYSFVGNTDTGMYRSNTNTIDFSTAGVNRVSINNNGFALTNQLRNSAGSAGSPSISFSGDTDTGLYNISADLLGASIGGTLRLSLSTTTMTFSDAINIAVGTTTGTKIGTATTQKIGFYGATPVVQGASVADATGGATIDAEARTAINDLISRIEATGLIATI